MQNDNIIDYIIKNEKGLTKNEVEKIHSVFDPIFFEEKIKEHQKKARLQKGVILCLVIFYAIACILLVAKSAFDANLIHWLQGILIGLCVVILVYIPNLFKNHSRIGLALRIVKELMEKNN